MRSLTALIRKDLRGYLDQPTGYILLVVFAAVASFLYFFTSIGTASGNPLSFTSLDSNSEASTRSLFTLLPWLLMVFVPASTMRLLAEEQRDGTLEILLTQPIQGWIVLLAKFLTGFIFVAVLILSTVGIPIALSTAGDVDFGAVAAQYVGSLFLAAAFVSIGLFTSSLTRNQVIAFILGLLFIGALMGLGLLASVLPSAASGVLQTLSPATHFDSIARGVIDLRDVLYFVALVSAMLSAAYLMIRGKSLSHQSPQYRNLQVGVAALIVLSLLVGWFGSSIGGRLDLTEDKLFTLSPATKDILGELDDLLTIELYQSRDLPADEAIVARDVNDFLDDLAASSGGSVRIVRKYPSNRLGEDVCLAAAADADDAGLAAACKARRIGVLPRQLNVPGQGRLLIQTGYLSLSITYADRREVVPFIGTVDGFEYRIASLTFAMIKQQRKSVKFLAGHGEKTPANGMQTLGAVLAQQYDVSVVQPSEDGALDLEGADVLIVAGPTDRIEDSDRAALTAYLDGGGKAMLLLDPVNIDLQRMTALPNRNSFADFVESYGVIVEDDIAFDVRSHETLQFGTQLGPVGIPFPYWMRAKTVDSKVAGDVESVVLPWASSVGFLTEWRHERILLLETSEWGAIDLNYRNSPDVSPNSRALEQVTEGDLFTAQMGVAVTRPAPGGELRLVVVGDSNWIDDSLSGQYQENLGLALNLVDWLAEEDLLRDVRTKVITSRQLLYRSDLHRNVVQYSNVAGVPALLVVIGLVQFVRRRNISQRVWGDE